MRLTLALAFKHFSPWFQSPRVCSGPNEVLATSPTQKTENKESVMNMLKKPLPRILIVSSVLLLIGVAALATAGRKNGIVVSNNGRDRDCHASRQSRYSARPGAVRREPDCR